MQISVFILLYIVSHVRVLFEKEPKHSVQLFVCLNLDFLLAFHSGKLSLHVLDALDIMLLELIGVSHDVVIRTDEVLLQLIVESLS